MIRLTNKEIDEIAGKVAEKLQIYDDIDMMQEKITGEGQKVYMSRRLLDVYKDINSADVHYDLMIRFPHYDAKSGLRFGLVSEWHNVCPATSISSADLLLKLNYR